MKIYLLRHAEVKEEYIGKYNGHIDIPLSQNGKLQAKKVAEELKDIKFDKIYCSDLLRARETLEQFQLKQKVIYSAKLREKSWGKHEGLSFKEIEDSGIKYENFQQWLSALDGESVESYTNNLQIYFNNTILKNKNKTILIVTHSGVIKTLMGLINNISLEESFKIKFPYSSYIIVNNFLK